MINKSTVNGGYDWVERDISKQPPVVSGACFDRD